MNRSTTPFSYLSPNEANWIFERYGTKADWVFYLLDKLDLPEVHRIIETARSSASMEIAPATGYTSVSGPWVAPTSPAAPTPSSTALYFPLKAATAPVVPDPCHAALSCAGAAPTAPAVRDPCPTALSSPAAAPSNMAVSRPKLTRMQV